MIPTTREEKVQWIRRNLIPLFDSQLTDIPEEELDHEDVIRSTEILAEQYLDEGTGIFKTFAKVMIPLVIIDFVSYMPAQVYGLVFSSIGTVIILVETSILGSESITARSMDVLGGVTGGKTFLDEDKARRLARNTVITNIGLIWLLFGFVMQIIAVWMVSNQTLIQPYGASFSIIDQPITRIAEFARSILHVTLDTSSLYHVEDMQIRGCRDTSQIR